ncbi:hypothetical protein EI613_25985 [Azospirillum sp. 412522]|nr:hypothetical protein [Azospirillum sp. 412522]MBY6265343.1 hypothetical protein [Azospirillum sp. 412522]
MLALPVQADGLSWRVDARSHGPGTGCCTVLAGATQGEDGGADSSLDSWLVMRERPPAHTPANTPPAGMPAADTVATHPTIQTATKTATQTTVLPKRSEAETDWRLMPFVAAQSPGGLAGQPIPLSIAVTSPYGQPNPQHEAITYVTIGNLPEKASLSNGERSADGVWKVPLEGLPDLTLTLPADIAETVSLHITAVTDHGGGVIARQAVTLAIPVAEAVAAAEPSGMEKPPLPAQGGSSQGMEAAAVPEPAKADPNPDPGTAGSSSAPPSPQEPQQSAPIVSETALGPAPDPAPSPAPSPAPDRSADRGPAPSADREVAAAPPVEAPPAVPLVTAAPSPPEPPVSTVALAAVPAVAAPPPEPQRPQPREAVVQRPAKPPSTIPEATLMKRGDDLFAQGDLAGARLYYEMAAEAGNAKAALALGRTHDPLVHERLHVRGLPPDPEQAASWYRRAIAAGSGDAEQQLQKLTVWLAGKSR